MNRKQQEKLGDLLLDVAKYIITAVLLATWFDDVSNWSRTSYLVPMGAVIMTAFAGISLYDHSDQVVEEKKKGKRKSEYDTSRCNALFGNCRFDSHLGICEDWQTWLSGTGPVSHHIPIKPCCFGNGAFLFTIVTFVEKKAIVKWRLFKMRSTFYLYTYPLSGVNNYLLSLKDAHNYKK